jgi:CRP-like cAMP-binding protein/predicted MFS family arabinose efflux permease
VNTGTAEPVRGKNPRVPAIRRSSATGRPLHAVSAAWFVTNLAEWAYITALSIHGYRVDGALVVGLIGARFAPGALVGSPLVAPLSRRRPAPVMGGLSLGRALAVALVAATVAGGVPIGVTIAIVWVDAIIAAPYRPVQSALLPALAGTPRELSAVAGSVPVWKALAQAAGALLGSLALAALGTPTVVAVAAGAFALTAVLLSRLATEAPVAPPELDAPARDRAGDRAAIDRLGAIETGFRLVAGRARPLLVLGGARSLTRGVWTSLVVVASLRLLGLGNSGVGLLMAAAGVGAAIAMPVALRFAGRRTLAGPAALAFAFAGIPITLVGITANPVAALALIGIWGLAFALADAISNALIHRVVDARRLAPSVAALEASKNLLEGLGALAAPALLAVFGIRTALIVAGALLPVLVVLWRSGLARVDERADSRVRPLAALRRTPSFRGLTMLALESIGARLGRTTAVAGEAIVVQGHVGDRFYMIDEGRVEVTIDGYRVGALGAGDSFGDKALLHSAPRTATVTATESTVLWSLDGDDFAAGATGDESGHVQWVRSADRDSLESILGGISLFGALDRRDLAVNGKEVTLPRGAPIVRQGERGETFYVILDGEVHVTIDGDDVRTLHPGESFGEIALLHDVPRTASVTAATPVTLWALGRDAFMAVLGRETAEPSTAGGRGAGLIV